MVRAGRSACVAGLRRSVAFQIDQRGVKLTVISAVLAHSNVAVTDGYIGRKLDLSAQNVLSHIDILPRRAAA